MSKYAIGLDYGTLSVRALVVDIRDGKEVCSSVYEYRHQVMDERLPSGKKLPTQWALQDPADYVEGLIVTVNEVLKYVDKDDIIGIGIDFTSSTILPVKSDTTPLCQIDQFKDEPHAYVKLWKHHGANEQALIMDEIIRQRNEEWISLYGGTVSSEWMFPKIYETLHFAPEVYNEADYFIEALDWITWKLTGEQTRSMCGAGYKAFYHYKNKYPSKDFFKSLEPRLENVVEDKLNAPIKGVGEVAGYLTKEYADLLHLNEGTPIGVGIIDAHASMIGSGISKPGDMMIIVGTSSCHMLLSEKEVGIEGVCGLVKDGIIPGYFAYEAGQCCVGDHFDWFVKNCVPLNYKLDAQALNMDLHTYLCHKLKDYKVGSSGLLALDWFNGVRSPLMDFDLNGMILGLNLQTKPEEIYLSLIEATAFGTRLIVESFENAGVPINRIILSGGIPAKNKLLVQTYADICKRDIQLSTSSQASAKGAAILGIAASKESGYKDIHDVVKHTGHIDDYIYHPNSDHAAIYDILYHEYKKLHHYYSKENNVMKTLNRLREKS